MIMSRSIISILFTIMIIILLYPASLVGANDQSILLQNILFSKGSIIDHSQQLILVVNKDKMSNKATMYTLEKSSNSWNPVFTPFSASIGKKGFADVNHKIEGDYKTPTGVFKLETAFGYLPSVDTKLTYRQTDKYDYWIDDPSSILYNKWVRGNPPATSYEKMRRHDNAYKYGIVVEYNTDPIIKGLGSAIFIHVRRRDGGPTAGCIAISEEMILRLLGWLDTNKNPLIIMGVASILEKNNVIYGW
jgi:L,D-peptidoglycan transpeptidase YkuD (ErfK/YbiS/YcfS/YnhG family)